MWLKIEGAAPKERFKASLDHIHRTALIYNMRFGDNKIFYSVIAEQFGISPERVRYLCIAVILDMQEQADNFK